MDIEYGVQGRFSAIHSGCPATNGAHGHQYEISVLITGDLDLTEGNIRGAGSLQEKLDDLLRRVDRQNLDDVLQGSSTSSLGLATRIEADLIGWYPKITEVTVRVLDTMEIGRVKRTPRGL